MPAKADPQKQEDYYNKTLCPLMKKAAAGEIVLLFMDASHFVMGCDFLGHIYSKIRRYIRTFSGRKRYNVLGALDYITKGILTVTNDTYITASEVCELLSKIACEYSGREIHVILDNARYQKCAVVQELAKRLSINLEYIPPYSPNLNLIERFWKFAKGELRSKYYSDFEEFKQNIDSTINSSSGENKSKIDKLIGKGVHLLKNLIQITDSTFVCDSKSAVCAT